MTNSERRITYMPQLVNPPGEALPDWKILTRFARALGFGTAFPYESAEEIFAEFALLTRGTACDYSGATYGRLKRGPLQWPCPAADHRGTERLYADLNFPGPTVARTSSRSSTRSRSSRPTETIRMSLPPAG
jgi:ferredoxin-nitrate reductase